MPALKYALAVFAADARRRLNAAQQPPEATEREDLLLCEVAQDVAHERRRPHQVLVDVNVSNASP